MKNDDKSLLDQYVPITDWLRDYSFSHLKDDTRAGLTVGILLIPQSMAYALLAGLPPIFGLYASIVPLAVYAVFGTSRQLAIGPVAIISILVASGIGALAEPGSSRYIELVLVTAFSVGVIQLCMGTLRLGFLMNFISKPVIGGFTSAAAFIIGFSQAGNLLGIEIERSKYVVRVLQDIIANLGIIHMPTILTGASSILFILYLKWRHARLPAELICVMISIFLVWFFDLSEAGIALVGSVQEGIPIPGIPNFNNIPWWNMAPVILAIAFLSFTQSIALAKAMVQRNPDYKVDSNQELFSLGLANIFGSIFQAYPVAGSFSRTAVNDTNRAKTSISLLVSACLVVITVLFLTPMIYYLPKAVLAAIIITAVPGLIEISEAKFLFDVRKRELTLMIITFIATLALGILEGIGVGVIISLGIVIHRSSYPNIVMLGRLPDTNHYRDLERHPEALTRTNTIIIRVDASLYFANIPYLKEKLEELEIESGKTLNQVIIDAIGINEVDSSALHALKEVVDEYENRNIEIIFTGVKGPVRDIFKKSGLEDVIGSENFYLDIQRAVADLHEEEEKSHLV